MNDRDVELQRLIDTQAIQQLWAEYADATNRQDIDDWVALFLPDAVWKRPRRDPLVGHAAFHQFMTDEGFAGNRIVKHVNGHGVIQFQSPERATGTTTTIVFDMPNTGELPIMMTGPKMMVEYRDELVKTAAGWKIALRDTTVVFATDNWKPGPAD